MACRPVFSEKVEVKGYGNEYFNKRKYACNRSQNIVCFCTSLAPLKVMERNGVITHAEYLKAEGYLAKKYCIKKDSIYRQNDLIFTQKRAIYIVPKEEVQDNAKDDNED